MDFFSIVGLTPVNSPRLSTTNLEVTQDCDSPDTAVDTVVYGSNKFTEDYISVGKGFYVAIDNDVPTILNLFMIRTRGDDERVAQISVSEKIDFERNKNMKYKNNVCFLMHGIHKIDANNQEYLLEYYFLSKKIY